MGFGELQTRLRRRISGFCGFLRRRGFAVGIGAEVDLGRAACSIDLLDPSHFRAACGATLAKSPEELRFVNAAFDQFWTNPDLALDIPWTGSESAALAPPKGPRDGSGRRRRDEPDVDRPPVVIPIGTYSSSAPSSGHPIEPLSERQMRSMRHGARRFRRQLATVPGRRRGPSRHGTVDLRDTVRQSLRHGGEWLELRHHQPRIARAEFVILWDVSGSMREHEGRLFGLVHALGSVSRSARIFAFSTRLEEITTVVRRYGYRRAATSVGLRIDRADGGTRIGRSLRQLADRYGSILRDRTTLVLISDGWDLGDVDLVREELTRLESRIYRIVWVTPYTRRTGFEPRVGALRAALGQIDLHVGKEGDEGNGVTACL